MKPIDKSKEAVKVYDKIATKYVNIFFKNFESDADKRHVMKFISLLPKNAKVLDVGCGPGHGTKSLMKLGFDVEGIDLSERMIEIARKKVPKGKFKVMDIRELKYGKNTFDALFANYSLIHIPGSQVSPTLKEFSRVLKPNGVLYLSLQEGQGERFITEPLNPNLKTFFKFFTSREIEQLLTKAKFKILYTARRKSLGKEEMKYNKLFIIAKRE